MTENITYLRGVETTSLNDIPGMLRNMAKDIENGEYNNVESLLIVMPRIDDFPLVFGFGNVDRENQPIVQLELAKAFFINNLVNRNV